MYVFVYTPSSSSYSVLTEYEGLALLRPGLEVALVPLLFLVFRFLLGVLCKEEVLVLGGVGLSSLCTARFSWKSLYMNSGGSRLTG